jgi:hypothetical protein
MATTWKERGVVPDSDDEEDDSQDAQQVVALETQKEDQHLPTQQHEHHAPVGNILQQLEGKLRHLSESPHAVFRNPPTLSALERESEAPVNHNEGVVDEQQRGDEVSRSFITISSRSSSLSSLSSLMDGIEDPTQPPQLDNQPDGGMQDPELVAWTNRRSLRQRAPIQLHPYAMEAEKYKRTLLARGLRPVRLTQLQDDARRTVQGRLTEDPEYDVEESQTISAEQESQESQSLSIAEESMDIAIEDEVQSSDPFVLSQVLPRILESESFTDRTFDATEPILSQTAEEEEPYGNLPSSQDFPDVSELVKRKADNAVRTNAKRQRITYSAKQRLRHSLPGAANSILATSLPGTLAAMERTPASPPATSSPALPLLSTTRQVERPQGLTTTSIWDIMDESDAEEPTGNLPTPATDNAQPVINLTASDVEEDVDGVSDADGASSSASDSGESVTVRHVGKKIRGVLPASWLRLDHGRTQVRKPQPVFRPSRSVSPARAVVRKGVAMPKQTTAENSPSLTPRPTSTNLFFLDSSDVEKEEDEPDSFPRFEPEFVPDETPDMFSFRMDEDGAPEDDHIDSMAPTQSRRLPRPYKRRTTTNAGQRAPRVHQPRITEALSKAIVQSTSSAKPRQIASKRKVSSKNFRSNNFRAKAPKKVPPPRLSILDALPTSPTSRRSLPKFLRVALRNARSRQDLGRHSPTRKFIRLANREDTYDAQAVLRDWGEGSIRPRNEPSMQRRPQPQRRALADVHEPTLNATPSKGKSGGHQRKVSLQSDKKFGFISTQSKPVRPAVGTPSKSKQTAPQNALQDMMRRKPPPPGTVPLNLRPAQLETSLEEHHREHPNLNFKSTKRTLDQFYRRLHQRSEIRGDLQLARFLSEEADATPPSPASKPDIASIVSGMHSRSKVFETANIVRRRKRTPQRIDAYAAKFRQPLEPLVLESIEKTPEPQDVAAPGKLLGLGAFGTVYTVDFDIFPLPIGVYFHESTFIGSGRLSAVCSLTAERMGNHDRGHSFYFLEGKQLRWGAWDETLSSELGLCFDWVAEQLEVRLQHRSDQDVDTVAETISFVVDWVQNKLSFSDQTGLEECLARSLEVLDGLLERLEVLNIKNICGQSLCTRPLVEVASRTVVLTSQLLRISRTGHAKFILATRCEDMVRRASLFALRLLFPVGLDPVRALYDNLQYLEVREAGMRSEQYLTEAWVIIQTVLDTAEVPRMSFWDMFNSVLLPQCESQLQDAKVLERIWYTLFTLLPLQELDPNGVSITGSSTTNPASSENWSLVQKIFKSIFSLYITKSRQSPSFNDYVRTSFTRVAHLLQVWGWRRNPLPILGTMFDFFASHKLAHLRNEEVSRSPRFLEELHLHSHSATAAAERALPIDPSDRTFHIFLKCLATSLRYLDAASDTRGMRNLIARVLPNHDRQYPKDQPIRQRDLASLRNHHDLLCTLFWAAPKDLRPPLGLLRGLVDPARGHREAYLIRVKTWGNLARFVIASEGTKESWKPFDEWLESDIRTLFQESESAEKEIRLQFESLAYMDQKAIRKEEIEEVVAENKGAIRNNLVATLKELQGVVRVAAELGRAEEVFVPEVREWAMPQYIPQLFGYYRQRCAGYGA